MPPRRGNGRKPYTAFGSRAALGGSVNARRVSSEMTAPTVFFSRRASSLAARSTSSSMSSVVRMHLVLAHQIAGRQAEQPIGLVATGVWARRLIRFADTVRLEDGSAV